MKLLKCLKSVKKCFSIILLITFSLTNLSFGDARMDLVAKTIDYLSPMLRTWGMSLDENGKVMQELIDGLGAVGDDFEAVSQDLKAQFATKYAAESLKKTWETLVREETEKAERAEATGQQKKPIEVAAGYWNGAREGVLKKWLIDEVVSRAEASFNKTNQGKDFSPLKKMIEEVLGALLIGIDTASISTPSEVLSNIDRAAAAFVPTAGTQAMGTPLTPDQAKEADKLIREANTEGLREKVESIEAAYGFYGIDGKTHKTAVRELTVNVYGDGLADKYNRAGLPINTHPGTGGEALKRSLMQVHQVSFLWSKLLNTVGITGRVIWAKHEIAHLDIVTVERIAKRYFLQRYDPVEKLLERANNGKIPENLIPDMEGLRDVVNSAITAEHVRLSEALGQGPKEDKVLKERLIDEGVEIDKLKIAAINPDIVELMVITWAKWKMAKSPVYESQEEFVNHILNFDTSSIEPGFDVSNIQNEMRKAIIIKYPEQQFVLDRREYSAPDVAGPETAGVYAASDTTSGEELLTVTIPGGEVEGVLNRAFLGKDEKVRDYKREITFTTNTRGEVASNWGLKVMTEDAAKAPSLAGLIEHIEPSVGVVSLVSRTPFYMNNPGETDGRYAVNAIVIDFAKNEIQGRKDGQVIKTVHGDAVKGYLANSKVVAMEGTTAEITIVYQQTPQEQAAYATFAMFAKNKDVLMGQKVDIFLPEDGINSKSDIADEKERKDDSVTVPTVAKRLADMFNDILGKETVRVVPVNAADLAGEKLNVRPDAVGVIGLPADMKIVGDVAAKLENLRVLPLLDADSLRNGLNRNLIEMTATAIMQARLNKDKILDKGDTFAADFGKVTREIYGKDFSSDAERHKLFLFLSHSDLAAIDFDTIETDWVKAARDLLNGWKGDIAKKITYMLGEMKPLIQELRQKFDAIKKTMWSA